MAASPMTAVATESSADVTTSEVPCVLPRHSHPHLAMARHVVEASPSPLGPERRRHSMAHGAQQYGHSGSRQPLLGPGPAALANHRHVHPLLQRHRSEDRPLLRHAHHRPGNTAAAGGVGCQRHLTRPLLQRPLLAHAHSVQQPPVSATHHHAPHHHHSHPRLSQKHRQKLFSRSKQYTSVCSGGSNSTNYAGDSGTRSRRSSREHADDDVEACPYHPWPEEPSSVISERCTRARINSAIFVSSEGKGFDSIEFIRRYGSQSVLCRKAKSAENVSASERQRRFSEYPEWETEDSTTGNGTAGTGHGGNSRRKKSLRQDSIELVECHKEPVIAGPPNVPSVTPGAVPVVAGTTATLVTVGMPVAIGSKPMATATTTGASAVVAAAAANAAGVIKPTPKLSNLPTLSVSGPSPPHEEEFL